MTPDEHQADKSARAVAEVLRTARAVLMAPSYAEAMAHDEHTANVDTLDVAL